MLDCARVLWAKTAESRAKNQHLRICVDANALKRLAKFRPPLRDATWLFDHYQNVISYEASPCAAFRVADHQRDDQAGEPGDQAPACGAAPDGRRDRLARNDLVDQMSF